MFLYLGEVENVDYIPCGYTQTQEGDEMSFKGSECNHLQAYILPALNMMVYTINDDVIYHSEPYLVTSIDDILENLDEIVNETVEDLLGEALRQFAVEKW